MRTKKSINHDASTATIVLIMADGTKFYRPFVNVVEADTVFWKLKELHPAANYLLRLGRLNLENDHVAIGQLYGVVTIEGGIAVEDMSASATGIAQSAATPVANRRGRRPGRKPGKRVATTTTASV